MSPSGPGRPSQFVPLPGSHLAKAVHRYAEAMAGVRKHPGIPNGAWDGIKRIAQCRTCARRIVLCDRHGDFDGESYAITTYWRHLPWNMTVAFTSTFAGELATEQLPLPLDNDTNNG